MLHTYMSDSRPAMQHLMLQAEVACTWAMTRLRQAMVAA